MSCMTFFVWNPTLAFIILQLFAFIIVFLQFFTPSFLYEQYGSEDVWEGYIQTVFHRRVLSLTKYSGEHLIVTLNSVFAFRFFFLRSDFYKLDLFEVTAPYPSLCVLEF